VKAAGHLYVKADHLYVIGDGSGAVKIGRAANPAGRLSSLQVGSSRPLSLLHVFPEDGRIERAVHGRLKSLHIHREWFDFGRGDPVTAVRDVIADIKSPRPQPDPDAESVERQRAQRELHEASRAWGRERRALETERNPLVLRALALGVSIEEIHQVTGLARTTIDRIEKAKEPSL
jgi:hypothetical protein